MASVLEGGCLCGRIRYQVTGRPSDETICHCSMCRRSTGAPFVAWFTVRPTELRFVRGEPTRFQSSSHATRSFCSRCGTQLTFQNAKAADEIDLTTCSLDQPEAVPPKDHSWTKTRLSWIELSGGLPEFSGSRHDE